MGRHIKSGRELVFSADLCYNGTNKKPPLCKWEKIYKQIGTACRDGGIVKISTALENNPSVSFADSVNFAAGKFIGGLPPSLLHKGAFGCARSSLGVWALPEVFVIQMRNWQLTIINEVLLWTAK